LVFYEGGIDLTIINIEEKSIVNEFRNWLLRWKFLEPSSVKPKLISNFKD